MPLTITSVRGHAHSTIDCRQSVEATGGEWGELFLRGETDDVLVTGLTLRKCLVHQEWLVMSKC